MKWLIVALIVLTMAIISLSSLEISYGAVILLGPIPIVLASDVSIAFLLILLTIVLLFFLLFMNFLIRESLKTEHIKSRDLKDEKAEKKYGGLVLIGPLPIIFGEARMAIIASFLAIILMILALFLLFGWLR
ncbi:MAG: DUF131 domain-containing protein [Archaeoglobaceae archaeon]